MRKQSIPCNDSLRYRAVAKARGDYEAHQVAQCSNAYASWCDDGNVDLASWAESRLRMFVDTPMRWKDACAAISQQRLSTDAKRMMRVHNRLGRRLTKEEKAALRRASTPKSDSTASTTHENPKSDKLTSCPTDSD